MVGVSIIGKVLRLGSRLVLLVGCLVMLAVLVGSPCEEFVSPQEPDVGGDGGESNDVPINVDSRDDHVETDDPDAEASQDPVAACFSPDTPGGECRYAGALLTGCPLERPFCCDKGTSMELAFSCCCSDPTCGGRLATADHCRETPANYVETACAHDGLGCSQELPYCCRRGLDMAICTDHALLGWSCTGMHCSTSADCPDDAPRCCAFEAGGERVCTNQGDSGTFGCSPPDP